MPLAIPPGYAHIAIQHRHSEDPIPWYITFGVDAGEAGGDLVRLAKNCQMAYWNSFKTALSENVTITGVQATLGSDGGEPLRAFVAADFVYSGTSNQAKLPQNCALLVRKNTALGGRRNRGRMFIPGVLHEGDVSAVGLINGTVVGTFETFADQFMGELNGDGPSTTFAQPMVLLHSTGETAVPAPTPVVSLSVDNVISTQRKRLR